jgi:AraC-like DNA-binding protein
MSISERHLSRVFRQSFGISPKRFTKIARIEKVLASRRDGLTWTEAAYACGFYDQSHMIRDFKEIVGQSPIEFFRPSQSRTELLVVNRRWIGTPYRHPKGTPLNGEFGR